MAVAPKDILEEVAGYLDFTERDAALLKAIGPLVEPYIHPTVDRFYDAIQANPGASSVITEGQAQIDRLKGTLRQWMAGTMAGVYDTEYLARRSRIGRMHVSIGLDQRYMFSAMNILREGMHQGLDQALDERSTDGRDDPDWPTARRREAHCAVDKICDMELAIMLETYREDYVARIRSTERLAALGQLAASIGHELRNPLAVVETSLHLLKRQMQGNARAERHSKRISDQVAVCNTIISDLLEMARDRPPRREPTHIADLVRNAIDGLPGTEGITFEIDIPSDLPTVDLDSSQVRQVLVNLAMNAVQAIKSAAETGRVVMRARMEGEGVRIDVEDNGPGLTPEAEARLFEPLFTTRSKGIGLGLALCHRIVEKHGGSIVGKNGPGGGAVFEVQVPVSPGGEP